MNILVLGLDSGCMHVNGIIDCKDIDSAKLEDTAMDALREGKRVLIVGVDAWKVWRRLYGVAWREGLNYFLLEAYDPREAILAHIDAKKLFVIRYRLFLSRSVEKALYRVNAGKPVSRRRLLALDFISVLEYINAPVLSDPQRCQTLQYCDLCSRYCLHSAIRRKPLNIDVGKCSGCGICQTVCPINVISTPGFNGQALIEYLTPIVDEVAEGYALIAPRRSIHELLTVLLEGDNAKNFPVIIIPVWSIGEVSVKTLLALRALGLEPTMFYDDSLSENEFKLIENTIIRDYEAIVERKLAVLRDPISVANTISKRPLIERRYSRLTSHLEEVVKTILDDVDKEVELRTPLVGLLTVRGECTLCGACSRFCPTNALSLVEEGGYVKLVFKQKDCIACHVCSHVCPTRAISVEYRFTSKSWREELTLIRDELVRCKSCGKPISSKRMLRKVIEELKFKRYSRRMLEEIQLCPDCKIRALLKG